MSQSETTEPSTLVYSFPRGEKEEIQFSLKQYKGRFYVDLRLWFQDEQDNNTLKPSKKGLSFSADHVPELKEGVQHLEEACRKSQMKAPAVQAPPRPQPGIPPKRQPAAWNRRPI